MNNPKRRKVRSKQEFLDLKVNVFINKANGQQMITLPKKILKDIPSKIDIKIPNRFFKIMKGGGK